MKYVMIIVIQLIMNFTIITDKFNQQLIKTESNQETVVDQEVDNPNLNVDSNTKQNFSISMISEEQEMINLINQTRLANDLNVLSYDPELYEIARLRANEIVQSFSHLRPNGEPFYSISTLIDGENLSRYGNGDALSTFDGFMHSPNHKDNILFADFKRVACFRLIENDVVYWVQAFGY